MWERTEGISWPLGAKGSLKKSRARSASHWEQIFSLGGLGAHNTPSLGKGRRRAECRGHSRRKGSGGIQRLCSTHAQGQVMCWPPSLLPGKASVGGGKSEAQKTLRGPVGTGRMRRQENVLVPGEGRTLYVPRVSELLSMYPRGLSRTWSGGGLEDTGRTQQGAALDRARVWASPSLWEVMQVCSTGP